jgi:hypothetical protein
MQRIKEMKILIAYILLISAPLLASDTKYSLGKAYKKDGTLSYIETHEYRDDNGSIKNLKTTYYTTEKEFFAQLLSDFSKSPYLPEYTFTDQRFGRVDRTKWDESKSALMTYTKEDAKSEEKSKAFEPSENLITGQGLHAYLYKNLDSLIKKNEATKIEFVIPKNQDKYTFKIKTLEIKEKENKVTFRVEMNSWLLRLVAPHIDITYNTKTKDLLVFDGPSNLLTDKGKGQDVKIIYQPGAKLADAIVATKEKTND